MNYCTVGSTAIFELIKLDDYFIDFISFLAINFIKDVFFYDKILFNLIIGYS